MFLRYPFPSSITLRANLDNKPANRRETQIESIKQKDTKDKEENKQKRKRQYYRCKNA